MAIFIEQFAQTLMTAVLLGCIYGLMCVALSMIFGIMGVINFAQGDFMMIGMYLTLFVVTKLLPSGAFDAAAPFVAALAIGPVLFMLGYVLHRLLIFPITDSKVANRIEVHQAQLIVTLGLALILENAALMFAGSAPASIISPMSSAAWQIPLLYDDFSAVFINKPRAYDAAICLGLSLMVFWFIRATRVGKSLRAAADNPTAATYMGINVDAAHRLAFGIGSALAGIAGGLLVLYYPAHPFVGGDFLIMMYAGVVLGGLGSVVGAFWGGFVIAVVQQLSTLIIPLQLQNATIFVGFLLLLLLRPQGFFGRSVDRA
jgi:branched-chain amino acid transport system permease protein